MYFKIIDYLLINKNVTKEELIKKFGLDINSYNDLIKKYNINEVIINNEVNLYLNNIESINEIPFTEIKKKGIKNPLLTKRIYECIISNTYNLIDEIKEYFNKDSDSNIESEINDSLKLLIELNLISKININGERYYKVDVKPIFLSANETISLSCNAKLSIVSTDNYYAEQDYKKEFKLNNIFTKITYITIAAYSLFIIMYGIILYFTNTTIFPLYNFIISNLFQNINIELIYFHILVIIILLLLMIIFIFYIIHHMKLKTIKEYCNNNLKEDLKNYILYDLKQRINSYSYIIYAREISIIIITIILLIPFFNASSSYLYSILANAVGVSLSIVTIISSIKRLCWAKYFYKLFSRKGYLPIFIKRQEKKKNSDYESDYINDLVSKLEQVSDDNFDIEYKKKIKELYKYFHISLI